MSPHVSGLEKIWSTWRDMTTRSNIGLSSTVLLYFYRWFNKQVNSNNLGVPKSKDFFGKAFKGCTVPSDTRARSEVN